MLDLDYVRQTAALGLHRTTADLVAHAATWVERSENLLAYTHETGTPDQAAVADVGRARVLSAFGELKQVAKQSPDDVSRCRCGYLNVRHAVRDLVFANPDVSFDQVVFGVRQAPKNSGNITVGRWNTHTPGGDIYVKHGFRPKTRRNRCWLAALGRVTSAVWNSRGMPTSWSSPMQNSPDGRVRTYPCLKRAISADISAREWVLSKKCLICLR